MAAAQLRGRNKIDDVLLFIVPSDEHEPVHVRRSPE
jgi:hypothetical protein